MCVISYKNHVKYFGKEKGSNLKCYPMSFIKIILFEPLSYFYSIFPTNFRDFVIVKHKILNIYRYVIHEDNNSVKRNISEKNLIPHFKFSVLKSKILLFLKIKLWIFCFKMKIFRSNSKLLILILGKNKLRLKGSNWFLFNFTVHDS